MGQSSSTPPNVPEHPVRLNVYDLHSSNRITSALGLGAYHTGVEYRGREYSFSAGGIGAGPPRECTGGEQAVFKESIDMGKTRVGPGDFNGVLREMRRRFPGSKYHVVTNNCNHFSEALCAMLFPDGNGTAFPAWVNRLARTGGIFVNGPKDAGSERAQRAAEAEAQRKALSTERRTVSSKQQAMLEKMRAKKAARMKKKADAKAAAPQGGSAPPPEPPNAHA
jgi:hypothetical protein